MAKEQVLLAFFRGLSLGDQASVLNFAEFLASRTSQTGNSLQINADKNMSGAAPAEAELPVVIPLPEDIPRPVEESVIKALKRLSASYPMLDKKDMLGRTSDIVMKHIIQGDDPVQVIDELETVFRDAYAEMKD
ncbi:MAG: Crp/Fnr family transcriptional regulator [Gammaproteobacteria bacterium]